MAKLMLNGEVAQVEITSDPDGVTRIAKCVEHQGRWISDACDWTERYATLNDAAGYAADHADYGRR